jgi:hypothetical protein
MTECLFLLQVKKTQADNIKVKYINIRYELTSALQQMPSTELELPPSSTEVVLTGALESSAPHHTAVTQQA